MLERLLIAAALLVAGALAYLVINRLQRRQATRRAREELAADLDGQGSNGHVRVLYFRSDGCTSCATQSRLLEELDDRTRRLIETVDVDRERERASAYSILTLPTTLVIDGSGEVRHVNHGVIPPQKLARQVADI